MPLRADIDDTGDEININFAPPKEPDAEQLELLRRLRENLPDRGLFFISCSATHR